MLLTQMELYEARDVLKSINNDFLEIGFSDYGGTIFDVANIESLERFYKYGRDYILWRTKYNGKIAIIINNGHTRDMINALSDYPYPLISDEVWSEIEYNQICDAAEMIRNDYNLRDTDRVNSALYESLSRNNSRMGITSLDYCTDRVMRDFKEYYRGMK